MPNACQVGAEVLLQGGVQFRIWAPKAHRLVLILNGNLLSAYEMHAETDGYWSLSIAEARPGDRYQYRINDDPMLYPDPASRYQPEGPHAASCIVDVASYRWTDQGWAGIPSGRHVLYEMHIGTFTSAGTYQAAACELQGLARLGITTIALLPLAEFDGAFGWGYDVVGFYAPYHVYGSPDDLKAFINEAHLQGIAVILDVVYNHIGPSGAYFSVFSEHYYSDRYRSDWGAAINFDGPGAVPVRTYFVGNAVYWVKTFHLDGLRFDATHFVHDASPVHILTEMVSQVRQAVPHKPLYCIGENESQQAHATDPLQRGGYGLDAVWNDDFHHAAHVAMRGRREAYFHDYHGNAQELLSAVKWGYLYQGQYYAWQKKGRGTPVLAKAPACFVHYLQNHDQVANSGFGRRLHTHVSPGVLRAMTALWLLSPQTPMLFQGQEFAASAPFLFFADHAPEMAASVEIGRVEFLSQFPSLQPGLSQAFLSRAEARSTFDSCKLDLAERTLHAEVYRLHQDLLALRREDPVFSDPYHVDGAVLSTHAFLLRFFANTTDMDRLLLINLGADLWCESVAEPLLAAPAASKWQSVWSSEHPKYGGHGIRRLDLSQSFVITGCSVQVFVATLIQAGG